MLCASVIHLLAVATERSQVPRLSEPLEHQNIFVELCNSVLEQVVQLMYISLIACNSYFGLTDAARPFSLEF